MSRRGGSPGLGAVALIALLATAVGLALASAMLTLPVALGWRDAPVVTLVALAQGLAWWWWRRRERGLVRTALRLMAAHQALALWAVADLAALVLLWVQGTASWARIGPAWDWVAAYAAARAALLALSVTWRVASRDTLRSRATAARGARLALLGAALSAPVWTHLAASSPAWQDALVGGLLALLALAAYSPAGAARETWVGLAGLLASPAVAIGGSAFLLGTPALPLAAALALSTLLPALGLAALALPAALPRTAQD